MKKLYFTVDKYTENIQGIEECTGVKVISIYTIQNGDVHKMGITTRQNSEASSEAIEDWFIDSDFNRGEYGKPVML